MRHNPGLAASPPVRDILIVARYSPFSLFRCYGVAEDLSSTARYQRRARYGEVEL
jgi:hypothetical protein